MSTIRVLAFIIVLAVAVSIDFQNTGPVNIPITAVLVDSGWGEEEAALSRALAIRAKALEKQSRIKFGENWVPKVSIKWSLGFAGFSPTVAEYKAETQILYFTTFSIDELNRKYKIPLRLMSPRAISEDNDFATLADHELGHALADIVSQRAGLDTFYTIEHFNSLSFPEKFGLKVVSEGIGMYFAHVYHPMLGEALGAMAFPGDFNDFGEISAELISYNGGYWLVHDVISQYGERGLVWLVSHPLLLDISNMRASATAYRSRALAELASQQ